MDRRFEYRSRLPASAAAAWNWHARPGALERLIPPWEDVRVLRRSGSIGNGDRAELELRLGPFSLRWLAEHTDSQPGRGFTDTMLRGPFQTWTHRHRFEAIDESVCRLSDEIDYRMTGGWLGDRLGAWAVDRQLQRTFGYRHRVTRDDLATHDRYSTGGSRRFLITGSSGLVGKALTAFLTTGGHEVVRLVRGSSRPADGYGTPAVTWDPASGTLDPEEVSGLDVAIHLAGAGIADRRWSAARKAVIKGSRIAGTGLLARSLAAAPDPPSVLVCASAVGYYGDRGDREVDEGSAAGTGFLADTALAWEAAAQPAIDAGIRVVFLRIGIVLTPAGGALGKLLPPFKAGIGGPLGHGRQYWSWISIDDLLGAVLHAAATEELEGPVNAVAPSAVRNGEFAATLGRVIGRPALLPAPAVALRALLGEMADEMLLGGAKVRPTRLIESGYPYRHPDLEEALRHLLGRTSRIAD